MRAETVAPLSGHGQATKRLARAVVTLAIPVLALLGVWRYQPAFEEGLDGAYYFHIARHVAEGRGLMTSVSLYHQGLHPLPQPSTIYPLWPLTLGAAGALLGMERAGTLLPKLLYVLDVVLLFVLAQRVARRWRRERSQEEPVVGLEHLAAVLLAANPVFFWCAGHPYTEGLAMGVILLALLSFDASLQVEERASVERWVRWGLTGVLAGLCYATRFQLVTVPVALALALAFGGLRRRWREVAMLALGAALPMGAIAWSLSRQPGFTPAILLDFAALHQLPELPAFVYTVPVSGVVGKLEDVLSGLAVSLTPGHPQSYWNQFSTLVLAPLAAAGVFLFERPHPLERLVRWSQPTVGVLLASVLVGLAAIAPVHLVHSAHWTEWLFGWRHGIPALFVLLPCVAWLATRHGRIPRMGGVILAGYAALQLVQQTASTSAVLAPEVQETRRELARWLDSRPRTPNVLAFEPQPLAALSRSNFYWLACWSPPEVGQLMSARLPIDYIVSTEAELGCRGLEHLRKRLTPIHQVGTSYVLHVFSIDHEARPPT